MKTVRSLIPLMLGFASLGDDVFNDKPVKRKKIFTGNKKTEKARKARRAERKFKKKFKK
jgi:hypothetical protein